ncbi:glycoside hydrolase family 172 protein [Parapedobacter koreensis]|uniref:DUF2961 domain-containing protein n=1 Tax=Parapedobacter koreensis TaxID=332977 RepID=A0A1H7PV02_9SPHI|nr:glycoside hydrolase family 172 protein [Parapedobacter koreensis]SEL39439.1 Protein of unknown function [Parapedobacter koreensis]
MKRFVLIGFASLFVLACSNEPSQQVTTLGSLLKEMTDFDAVAKYPSPVYTLKQASSHDRRSIAPDKPGWFANTDYNQFIREEKNDGRTEYVMLDAEGPGAIVRFWLTTVVKPGIMRFYFDNEADATIEIPGFDLLKGFDGLGPALLNPHTSYEPDGKGGNTLYLPLLYQKHCKVTWEYTDTTAIDKPHYYQINYRTYAPGTNVETFTPNHLTTYKSDIDQAEKTLWKPAAASGEKTTMNQQLPAGGETSVALPGGTNAIRTLAVRLNTPDSADYEKIWRSTWLKITFDNHETVLCPLGDFIGSGYGGHKIASWFRDLSADGELTSRWVMPYQQTAEITFINKGATEVGIAAAATVGAFEWDEATMYFHALYKYEENIHDAKWDYDVTKVATEDSTAPIDWNFATLSGKGVYMGNTLSINNHMETWYGEGDAKAYVDNETFPSEFGTGLEDYYNTSWAPVILYQTPFANAPRADDPSSKGYNTFTRTRMLDAIPFKKAFSFDMEMLSWDGGTIDAAATTYWYGFEKP